jgi:hypothetical protein
MTYSHIINVPAPVEVYDATHAELLQRTAGRVNGLVLHLCRPTHEGFQVIEVWSSRDDYERADRELVSPILAAVSGPPPDAPQASPLPQVEEFALRGLVIPAGGTII